MSRVVDFICEEGLLFDDKKRLYSFQDMTPLSVKI
jgi:hypothetical protein